MFLKCYETNEYVTDFMLIYDTDNIIHLDFYADGLLIEPEVLFGISTHYEKAGCGLIKADANRHDLYERMFDKKIKKSEFVENISKKMIKSVIKLHRNCMRVEKSLEDINVFLLNSFYNSICEVMAYRRFVEKIQDKLNLSDIKGSNSYLLKLNKQLYKLSNKVIDINSFIWKYGFLYDFKIKKSPLETKSGIRKFLKSNDISLLGTNRQNNEKDNLLNKRFCWYEESRHYYQLRALRNFRILFEKNKLNIYDTEFNKLKLSI